jgi:hypothetical protein
MVFLVLLLFFVIVDGTYLFPTKPHQIDPDNQIQRIEERVKWLEQKMDVVLNVLQIMATNEKERQSVCESDFR